MPEPVENREVLRKGDCKKCGGLGKTTEHKNCRDPITCGQATICPDCDGTGWKGKTRPKPKPGAKIRPKSPREILAPSTMK